jgi:hypothetical protein
MHIVNSMVSSCACCVIRLSSRPGSPGWSYVLYGKYDRWLMAGSRWRNVGHCAQTPLARYVNIPIKPFVPFVNLWQLLFGNAIEDRALAGCRCLRKHVEGCRWVLRADSTRTLREHTDKTVRTLFKPVTAFIWKRHWMIGQWLAVDLYGSTSKAAVGHCAQTPRVCTHTSNPVRMKYNIRKRNRSKPCVSPSFRKLLLESVKMCPNVDVRKCVKMRI